MRDIDIKTIPKAAARHKFYKSSNLIRIELRTDKQRRMVSAIFRSADGKREDKRTLIWEPSEGRYHYEDSRKDVDKDWAVSLQTFWASMVSPDEAQLIEHQLGIVEEVRESLEERELLKDDAGK